MSDFSGPVLQIKARRGGFTLIPEAHAPFEAVLARLAERLSESPGFFRKARMVLELGGRPLRAEEIGAVRATLAEKVEGELTEVRVGEDVSPLLAFAAEVLGVPVTRSAPGDEAREGAPLIVRTTLRSGARIDAPGDCVVVGDVNPGAEVVARGDIMIFGSLRGIAHAGAGGDRGARIYALSVEPTQLRIADLVAVPGGGGAGRPGTPRRFEVAEVVSGAIQVTTL